MTNKTAGHGKAAGWSLGSLAALALALKVGWIVYSKKYIDHHAKVNLTLEAEHHTFESETVGKIKYYESKVESKQTPILLVHGIHLFAGAHDMVPVFGAFSAYRKVYLLDLPGFGAVNFLLHDVLGGGGMASLRTDNLAKAYAQVLLSSNEFMFVD